MNADRGELLKRKYKYHIRSVLLLSFSVIIVIMTISSLVLSNQYKLFFSQFHISYTNLAKVAVLSEKLDKLYYDVTGYAAVTKEDRDKIASNYAQYKTEIMGTLATLKPQYSGTAYYHIVDLANMVLTMDENVQQYFKISENSESHIYSRPQLRYIERLKGYIQNELDSLSNIILRSAQSHYENFDANRRRAEAQMALATSFVVLLCLATAFFFSRFISRPIGSLVKRMESFSDSHSGNVHTEHMIVSSEVSSLIDSYNRMTAQIGRLISELKEKADIERLLAQQKVDNLEMKNLLQRAELHMLQMQINPHFLFNTLNSINALATIEQAEQTSEMIENLAGMLRYSLRDLDRFVPLHEEIANVVSYIGIQRMRFGQRIGFDITVDESVKNVNIPSMIIQPLVENAIMHGLENKEKHGHVELAVTDGGDTVVITVRDDGSGIEPARLKEILNAEPYEHERGERGIGMDNVMRRLSIIYGTDCTSIHSEVGKGTTVTLTISKHPRQEAVEQNQLAQSEQTI